MSNRLLLPNIALVLVLAGPSATSAQSSTETYTYDALGRLVKVVTSGGSNNSETQSICYDAAGNRTDYVANTSAGATVCGGSPTPTPPPPNNPPTTGDDSASGACLTSLVVNLTQNDDDPEDNYPLTLTAITQTDGSASATIASASSVNVTFGPALDISTFDYIVQDSLGASSTGELAVLTLSCGGGDPPPGEEPPPGGGLPPPDSGFPPGPGGGVPP